MTINCSVCLKIVYEPEKLIFNDVEFHKNCFRCSTCKCQLEFKSATSFLLMPFCEPHGKAARLRYLTPTILRMHGKDHYASATAMDVFGSAPEEVEEAKEEPVCGTPALDSHAFKQFLLTEIEDLTRHCKRFRFSLEEGQSLNLPTASCVMIRAPCGEEGEMLLRPYTPITPNSVEGYFDLLIKKYPAGKMSNYVHGLKVGDKLDMKGPFKKFQYPFKKRRIGCIAGGTGLTPILQCVHEIVENPDDDTRIDFIFASATPNDILMKDYLDALAEKHENFNLQHIVRRCMEEDNWTGPTGYVPVEMIERMIPAPADDIVVFVCGPPSLMRSISGRKGRDENNKKIQGDVDGILKELGYTPDMIYKF